MPTLRSSALSPPYRWNTVARRYVDSRGRFVPQTDVNSALESVLESSQRSIGTLTQSLQAGQLSVADWQLGMAREMKSAHLVAAASGRGGWAQLSPADYGWVGQRLRTQYQYLARFAKQVAGGQKALDGTAVVRANMYGQAARSTQREMTRRVARSSGQTRERNVLGPADHCRGCLAATRQGWVELGTLVPIGKRECLTNCRCDLEYATESDLGVQGAA